MSTGAYSPDKILAHPHRLLELRRGNQPFPIHLHLILSDLCNLDCPGCAYRMAGYPSSELFVEKHDGAVNRNPARFLDTDLVRSVLEDCAMMGTHAIEFTGGGEPTLHKDCGALIDYAQCLGLDTALITNGIMLHHIGDPAVKTKWLRVSLDAASPETYMTVRPSLGGGRAMLYARVIENLRWAVEAKKRLDSDCTIGVGFVVQERNWHEIVEAARLAYNVGADNIRISGLFTPAGETYHGAYRQQAEALEKEAMARFDGKNGFRVYGRFHEKLEDLHARPDYTTCWYQHVTTYLGADANLYRCCVTSYNRHGYIGSVKEAGGLRKLWESAEKKNLFDLFDARSCPRCQFNDRNRAIEHAVRAREVEPVPELQHKNFV